MKEMETHRVRWKSDLRVGILGGGQLALMLAQAAVKLGLSPRIYLQNKTDPAIRSTEFREFGRYEDTQGVADFLKKVDLAVFENEFIPLEGLGSLENKAIFIPPSHSIRLLSDKGKQKALLLDLKIPTARHLAYSPEKDIKDWIRLCINEFNGRPVFKWGRMGYDGKGVFQFNDTLHTFAEVEHFCKSNDTNISLYAEESIAFQKEISIIGCRSVSGEFVSYPLVVTESRENMVDVVKGPASLFGVTATQEQKAIRYAREIADETGLVGTFAIELFIDQSGQVLVNEIAPRVHNTGHFTIDASDTSQYENHWRAALDLPLGETHSKPAFAMLNLIGPPGVSRNTGGIQLPVPAPNSHLHWYGKKELRPRRKMGHLNGVTTPERLTSLIEALRICRNEWERKLGKS